MKPRRDRGRKHEIADQREKLAAAVVSWHGREVDLAPASCLRSIENGELARWIRGSGEAVRLRSALRAFDH